ncbi:MAG TPA: hypothetical protein VFD60_08410 [Nitrososphaeraceae archaeon]|nr:hypothetical protein [Nitrososphaeraceae archaeon]
MSIISIITLIQSFVNIQPNPGSDMPPFATSMKVSDMHDNASRIYSNITKIRELKSCDTKINYTCSPLKQDMIWASFILRDYKRVHAINSSLYQTNNNITSQNQGIVRCLTCLPIKKEWPKEQEHKTQLQSVYAPIINQTKIILAETLFNEENSTENSSIKNVKHRSSNLTSDIMKNLPAKPRPIDHLAIYLEATSRLNHPKNAATYDNLTELNRTHGAVANITKNGELFYLDTAGHKVLAMEGVVLIFVKNINYFIIGTLIASLIAFPIIVRHYTHEETSQ